MERSVTAGKTTSGNRIWLFLILAYAIAWPVWIASGVLGREDPFLFDFRWLLAQVGVFGPSVAALIVAGTFGVKLRRSSLLMLPVLLFPLAVPGMFIAAGSPAGVTGFPLLTSIAAVIVAAAVIVFFFPVSRRVLDQGTGNAKKKQEIRWIILSVVFFPGLFLLAWFLVNLRRGSWEISALRGGTHQFVWIVLVSFANNLLLGGPLGEEIGWRGFLLPQLMRRYGPYVASLLLAVVWALWHLPIDISSGFLLKGPGAVLIRIIWTIPITIIFTWFYIKSGGSLLIALLLHTSINILSDLGFSGFEQALVFFFFLMVIAAILLSAVSGIFRKARE